MTNDRYLKYCGNALVIIAATVITFFVPSASTVYPFILYTLGAVCWGVSGFITKDNAVLQLNLFFIFINLYAIIIRM